MATIKCSACQVNDSIAFCSESGQPLCADCTVTCQVCAASIGRDRVQFTSTGRQLCARCMAERNARRKAKKERKREEARARKRARLEAEAGPTSLEALGGIGPQAASTTYNALMGDTKAAPDPMGSAPAAEGPAPEGVSPREGGAAEDEGDLPSRTYGLEGVPTDRSTRLELPPIDEQRPVLKSSGYQPPTRLAYLLAFLFFGIAGLVFYGASPGLRDLMWPFHTTPLQFDEDRMPVATDTNRLRNASNINQLELFSQGPIFFVTWGVMIVYLGGTIYIIVTTSRGVVSTYFSKRNLKKAEKHADGDPFSSLG